MFHRYFTFFLRLLPKFYSCKTLQESYKRASHSHLCNFKPDILLQPLPRCLNDCFFLCKWWMSFLCKTGTRYSSWRVKASFNLMPQILLTTFVPHTKLPELQWPWNPNFIQFKPFGVRLLLVTQHNILNYNKTRWFCSAKTKNLSTGKFIACHIPLCSSNLSSFMDD
jgi:hypothetical protein